MMEEDHHHHHHYHHHHSAITGRGTGFEHTFQGRAAVRLLCHTDTAGGVIGAYGTFVKHLECVTGAKINLTKTIPNCCERVIEVCGNTHVDRNILLEGHKWNVSQLQEAVIRVFERILEVEGSEIGKVGCRLLVGNGQVGGVIGVGGNVLTGLEKRLKTKIRILPPDQLPNCALLGDELIQIMGNVVAVKKSLVAVVWRLQIKKITKQALRYTFSCEAFSDNSMKYTSVARPLSAENGRALNSHENNSLRMVEFRLLCSAEAAGGVIGSYGNIVKALEEETGASIKFSGSLSTLKERTVTVAALECPEPMYSPAQIALIRVFARSVEVEEAIELASGLVKGKTITARLLVDSKQLSCLVDTEGFFPDINTATGVQMQLLVEKFIAKYASENDNVLQITGLYENVKSALFQVTGRLRDHLFSEVNPDGDFMPIPFSANPNNTHYGREEAVSSRSDHMSGVSPYDHDMTILIHEMDQLGLLYKPVHKEDVKSVADANEGMETSECALVQGSVDSAALTNTIEEVEIPDRQVLGCVYGENGSNLSLIKEISGASIMVEDPCPGKSLGKVIISGTVDRVEVARSLLLAFIQLEL